MGLFGFLFKKKSKKIKLGLALGSGGAKGFFELGVLRAFEENGISFDIVSGTSIGSIIGAFYANGYSSTDMLELFKTVNFSEITSFFMINTDTAKMFKVIDDNIGFLNIEDLKKPFACVGTNLNTGEAKYFVSGSVAKAICASCSMPPFFRPVVIENERFIDGAFSNSIPADFCKEKGADYIVSVDLAVHDTKPGLLSNFYPTFPEKDVKPWHFAYELSNVVIHPDMSAYSAVAINKVTEMYDYGYKEALKVIPKILKDLEKLKN